MRAFVGRLALQNFYMGVLLDMSARAVARITCRNAISSRNPFHGALSPRWRGHHHPPNPTISVSAWFRGTFQTLRILVTTTCFPHLPQRNKTTNRPCQAQRESPFRPRQSPTHTQMYTHTHTPTTAVKATARVARPGAEGLALSSLSFLSPLSLLSPLPLLSLSFLSSPSLSSLSPHTNGTHTHRNGSAHIARKRSVEKEVKSALRLLQKDPSDPRPRQQGRPQAASTDSAAEQTTGRACKRLRTRPPRAGAPAKLN
jgi:hypothetical protein